MEDYNTATLPHKKFYDLDLYERRRLVKAAKKGKTMVCASDSPRQPWSVGRCCKADSLLVAPE